MTFVSRAGQKLEHALITFKIDVTGLDCADLGCNAGGFVDCLLQRGAGRVYAIDTGYGALDWKLRKDPRVVVMERTNAMHAHLPQPVNFISIDVAWTRQTHILHAARRMLKPDGQCVTLIKPHYESDPTWLKKGILPPERLEEVLAKVREDVTGAGFVILASEMSPIKGTKGNLETLFHLQIDPRSSPKQR